MLESLHLKNVGPAPEMDLELAPRLNLITGDNGLGKSFLLDVAWWTLTRTWARQLIIPPPPPLKPRPQISYGYTKSTRGSYMYKSTYDRKAERWSVKNSRPAIPGLVLYAQVDGGFSVWDPARNYWKADSPERPSSYLFAPQEVWEGNVHCEGLIRDLASWQRENGKAHAMLNKVLRVLSPSKKEQLVPGDLRKLTVDDPRRYPTLRMPYDQDIAVTHASAGMRRIVALTYLLIWAWQEHVAAAEVRGDAPAREIIFLIDEIEAHLHPQWQRRIVPAVLKVMDALTGRHGSRVQLITATHSPLDMLDRYERRCAYSALYFQHGTGSPTVDHAVPKSRAWDQVYEWSNYRLCAALINSRKNDLISLIDPFRIADGWFALEFVGFQVTRGPNAPAKKLKQIDATLSVLNMLEFRKAREEYVADYKKEGTPLAFLERRAPFVAAELRRQGRLRKGDR